MKNIHVLPKYKQPIKGDLLLRHLWKGTKNECISWWRYNETITIDGVIQYTTLNGSFRDIVSSFKTHNIYITSNEEIKEGDYGYIPFEGGTVKCIGKYFANDWRKIILTTDQDLIKEGVQAIDDKFLEWFVKNPNCENVNTESTYKDFNPITYTHKILIPKEEPKQETLEEVADKLYPIDGIKRAIWRQGAKWQQNRSYSEEEVLDLLKALQIGYYIHNERVDVDKWFEHFKKKKKKKKKKK